MFSSLIFLAAPPNGETEGQKPPGGVRGPMVMPSFDPSRARAQLKKAAVGVSQSQCAKF